MKVCCFRIFQVLKEFICKFGWKIFFKMSKASQSTKFRGVDVDELDENKFQDDGDEDSGQSGPDEAEVNNLLMQYPFSSNVA